MGPKPYVINYPDNAYALFICKICYLLMWNRGFGVYWKHFSVVGNRNNSGLFKYNHWFWSPKWNGSHADPLKNNILRDNSSKPSIKDYAVKHSKQSQSHRRGNRRPVILCCCRWTNIWVYTSAVNQNYSTLDASEHEVLCNTSMFLCDVSAFITFITPIFQNSYYGAF